MMAEGERRYGELDGDGDHLDGDHLDGGHLDHLDQLDQLDGERPDGERLDGERPDVGELDGKRLEAAARDAVARARAERDDDAGPVAWDAAAVARPIPDSVISDGRGGCLLPAGEVSVLAGLSGAGKSTLTLHAAVAAAATREGQYVGLWRDGPVIRGGPVVVVGYEDAAAWVHLRAKDAARWRDGTIDGAHAAAIADPARLSVGVLDAPLFAAPDPRGAPETTGAWDALWSRVREIGARFVVIDPAALAVDTGMLGFSPGPVSTFYRALRREAREVGAAVLIVAHMPKAVRAKAAGEVDAGDVAGSAAWVDRARSALTLTRDADRPDGYVLGVAKANYAATGTTWNLTVRRADSGRPLAFEVDDAEDEDTIQL